ncbi:MAG: CDP-alcohol phosphatidyltransferase family protein [Opitutales bacterium]
MSSGQTFGGASKAGESILGPWEKKLVARWVNCIPAWLETYHLTLLTIPWTGLVIASAWQVRATGNIHWFWGVSLAIALQYLSDLFDGAVGRARGTGLIKWGFYMDHFLDFLFQCGLIVAYALIAPPEQNLTWWFFGILGLTSGYMVNSFLCFAATNEFEIYFLGIGPTEIRVYFLALNAVIILLDPTRAYFAYGVPNYTVLLGAGLVFLTWKSHAKLWAIDMKAKNREINHE